MVEGEDAPLPEGGCYRAQDRSPTRGGVALLREAFDRITSGAGEVKRKHPFWEDSSVGRATDF